MTNRTAVTIEIANEQYVYLDEENIASLAEMIDFVNANQAAFYQHRRKWWMHHWAPLMTH